MEKDMITGKGWFKPKILESINIPRSKESKLDYCLQTNNIIREFSFSLEI